MSLRTPDWIVRILVFYRDSNGRTRSVDVDHPNGNEDWSAEDWLNACCATRYVRSNWLRIEATREQPFLRRRFDAPQP